MAKPSRSPDCKAQRGPCSRTMMKSKSKSKAKSKSKPSSRSTSKTSSRSSSRQSNQSRKKHPKPSPKARREAQEALPLSQLSPAAGTPSATLGDRFHSLPGELRRAIFAQLLVWPVKWDLRHRPDCPVLASANPFQDHRPHLDIHVETCAQYYWNHPSRWRHRWKPIHVDPWRSRWAPPQGNPYLCTMCYDLNYPSANASSDPRPPSASLPCLCARRDHLQTLLVCRRWYAEAGAVLYSGNTLAFGSARECAAFFARLQPAWRALVSRVSLLTLAAPGAYPATARDDLADTEADGAGLRRAWALLGALPGLAELELDAGLLTRRDCVRVLRGPGALRNLRRVTFSQGVPMRPGEALREYVWPRRGVRKTIEDSEFACGVARGIKGRRFEWVKQTKQELKQAVKMEEELFCARFAHLDVGKTPRDGARKGSAEAVADNDVGLDVE
ncbi:hypothetical protein F5Y15DRAFT_427906 [Xylariaceae sp. FL0016]|nr:hypothetical protein F5Y15DRAFT_427906 [Xylariaceae sp. FL0016]